MSGVIKIELTRWNNAGAVALFLVIATIGSSAQTFRTLVNFNGSNGTGASSPIIQGFDGNYYGTTGRRRSELPAGFQVRHHLPTCARQDDHGAYVLPAERLS
jgi:hypothetical protein